MRTCCGSLALVAALSLSVSLVPAQSGPYKVLQTAKVGGDGGFDYLSSDVQNRRLYVPRNGETGQLMVFDLDTLAPVGSIPGISAGGAAVDPRTLHGFSTTSPMTMWDARTLKIIKTIDVDSRPNGIMFDPFNERVWLLSHQPPYATIIDAKDGAVVGTLDLGGAAQQAVTDGKGTIYVNISSKANIAVVDAKNLKVTAHYDVNSEKVTGGSGLAFDERNQIIFAYYRTPKPIVVILSAKDGSTITTLPTGGLVDTVTFNPKTMEAISADGVGSMTFIKENSPTSFSVEQTLTTTPGAKTLTFDSRTGHLITMTGEFEPPLPDAPPPLPGNLPRGPMIPGSFSLIMVGK